MDLYLVGCPLKGHFIALRSGHSLLNVKLVSKIAQQRKKYASTGISSDYGAPEGEVLDTAAIKKILPHREPFLFVDKIISCRRARRRWA